jgi:hypothetical protein
MKLRFVELQLVEWVRGTSPEDRPEMSIRFPKTIATPGVKPDQWVETESKFELRFKVVSKGSKYELMPMCQIRDQRYSVHRQTDIPNEKS